MPAQISSIAKAVKAAPDFLARYGLEREIANRNVLGRGQFAVVVGPPMHGEIAVKFTVDDEDAALASLVLAEQERRGGPVPGLVEVREVVRFADDVRGKALSQRVARAVGKEGLTTYTKATLYAVVMERVESKRFWTGGVWDFEMWVYDRRHPDPEGPSMPTRVLPEPEQKIFDALVDGYMTLANMGYELLDIRDANVGWSERRQQAVLFDFGVYDFTGMKQPDAGDLPMAKNTFQVTADLPTQRGTAAIVAALMPRIGRVEASDIANNVAGALLGLYGDETSESVMAEMLRGRRKNWPNDACGSLTDDELDALAAKAAAAWDARSMEPNARVLRRTVASFDRHFDEAANRFPDLGTIELHHDEAAGGDNGHGSERQFGFCEDGKPLRISFAAKIEDLPQKNIDGLVAHEFGHALDYRYGKRELERMLGIRLPDGAERRADAIAGAVFGKTIRYDQALVQCVSCKGQSPRPKRLGP